MKHNKILLDKTLKSGYYIELVNLKEGFKVVLKLLKKNKPQRGAIIYKRFGSRKMAEDFYDSVNQVVLNNKEQMKRRPKTWVFKTHIFKFLMVHRN